MAMSIEQAMALADVVTPMPAEAHEALRVLRAELTALQEKRAALKPSGRQERSCGTVRELLGELAHCDLDAKVTLFVPDFMVGGLVDGDSFEDSCSGVVVVPEIVATMSSLELEAGKCDGLSIGLSEADHRRFFGYHERRRDGFGEPEPALESEVVTREGDAVTLTVAVSGDDHAHLVELVQRCNQGPDEVVSHGRDLHVGGLLAMLAEDAALIVRRPGCWEASNMHQVLSGHGYGA